MRRFRSPARLGTAGENPSVSDPEGLAGKREKEVPFMLFEDFQLAPPILEALGRCGHHTPTPVQAQAIPAALEGRDLIVSAQTGTGKTAAFVLPALQFLTRNGGSRPKGRGPLVLVLTPTRELADQVTDACRIYGKCLKVKSCAIFGGMPFSKQLHALAASPELVVATPGRLLDLMNRRRIDLAHVEIFVLDEADRMLDMGFIEDVERIASAVPGEARTYMFGATLGKAMTRLADRFMKDPRQIRIAPEKITHECIEQRLHAVDDAGHKSRLLEHLCADPEIKKAIIFSATKIGAESLAKELRAMGHSAAALHGDMKQNARNRTMLNMRRGKIRLLVATDVAARGLDVTGISHVINYDLPRFAEDYVHRIGRTGRAGQSGIAISMASRGDLPHLARIERHLGHPLSLSVIEGLEPSRPLRKPRSDGPGNGRRSNGFGHPKGFRGAKPAGKPFRPGGKRHDGPARGPGEKPFRKREEGGSAPGYGKREAGGGHGYGKREFESVPGYGKREFGGGHGYGKPATGHRKFGGSPERTGGDARYAAAGARKDRNGGDKRYGGGTFNERKGSDGRGGANNGFNARRGGTGIFRQESGSDGRYVPTGPLHERNGGKSRYASGRKRDGNGAGAPGGLIVEYKKGSSAKGKGKPNRKSFA